MIPNWKLAGWCALVDRRISPKQLAELGWELSEKIMGHFPHYQHRQGWRIEHCGHPTANWPYSLFDPAGRRYCQGAFWHNDPDLGPAWQTIAQAAAYVETVLRASNDPGGQEKRFPHDGKTLVISRRVPGRPGDLFLGQTGQS